MIAAGSATIATADSTFHPEGTGRTAASAAALSDATVRPWTSDCSTLADGRRRSSSPSVARTTNETARLSNGVTNGRRPEMSGDPVDISTGGTRPALLGYSRSVGGVIDSSRRRHAKVDSHPCEVGLPTVLHSVDSLPARRLNLGFCERSSAVQSAVVRSSTPFRSRDTVYDRESRLPLSAGLSVSRLVTSHPVAITRSCLTRGRLELEPDRFKNCDEFSISFLTASSLHDVIKPRLQFRFRAAGIGNAIKLLSCIYRRCSRLRWDHSPEAILDPPWFTHAEENRSQGHETRNWTLLTDRFSSEQTPFSSPVDDDISRYGASLHINGTNTASAVSCWQDGRVRSTSGSSKRRRAKRGRLQRRRDGRFRRCRDRRTSHSTSLGTCRQTTTRSSSTSGCVWLTFVAVLQCLSLLVGAANTPMHRQSATGGAASGLLLSAPFRPARPSSASNPLPVGAGGISGSGGSRSPRSDGGILSGTMADGPGLPCIFEGHIKTDRYGLTFWLIFFFSFNYDDIYCVCN